MIFKLGSAIVLMVCATQVAGAQTTQSKLLKDNPIPAEFPPESFTGPQYIDSEGCAFIRAGSEDRVVWVPRVTRNRVLVCGMQPTFSPESTAQ